MAVKRISPTEAHDLLGKGYVYLDVRSVPEYEGGHPPGAYNIPLLHMGPGGMAPNPDFSRVVERTFPDKDALIVCGCKAGGRSIRAAEMLEAAGYRNVVDMRAGYAGDGKEQGWSQLGLPTEPSTPGKSWSDLSGKQP